MTRAKLLSLLSRPLAKRLFVAFMSITAIAIIVIPFLKVIKSPRGDFPRHVEFGRRLLDGEFIYTNGLDVPYPPSWALAHAPIARLPLSISQPLVFPLGVISLALLITIVNQLAAPRSSTSRFLLFVCWSAALFVSLRFVMRDFDECGPNLFLVMLSWFGLWCWSKNRDLLGGASIALAIALKCTAGLFLLYFLWKRQWKIAATITLATILFLAAPILVQGRENYTTHMRHWIITIYNGATTPSPLYGVLGEDPLINKSLRSALARYLVTAPQGHTARVPHPAYRDFLNLEPRTASRLITLVSVTLLAVTFWLCRRPLARTDTDTLAWEGALISLVTLYLSPITWGQHCVATLPALFLLFRRASLGQRPTHLELTSLGLYFFVVFLLNRWMFSSDLAFAIESYRPVTGALLLLGFFTARALAAPPSAQIPLPKATSSPARQAA